VRSAETAYTCADRQSTRGSPWRRSPKSPTAGARLF